MPTLYAMLTGFHQNISKELVSVDFKLSYLVEPEKKIEFNDVSMVFEGLSKLQTLEEIRLETDFPNFKLADRILKF